MAETVVDDDPILRQLNSKAATPTEQDPILQQLNQKKSPDQTTPSATSSENSTDASQQQAEPQKPNIDIQELPKEVKQDPINPRIGKYLVDGQYYHVGDRQGNPQIKKWNAAANELQRADDPDVTAAAAQKFGPPIDSKVATPDIQQSDTAAPQINKADQLEKVQFGTYKSTEKIADNAAVTRAQLQELSLQPSIQKYMQLKALYNQTDDADTKEKIATQVDDLAKQPFKFNEGLDAVDAKQQPTLRTPLVNLPDLPTVADAVKYTNDQLDEANNLRVDYTEDKNAMDEINNQYQNLQPKEPKGFFAQFAYGAIKAIKEHSDALETANTLATASDDERAQFLEHQYWKSKLLPPTPDTGGATTVGKLAGGIAAPVASTVAISTAASAATGNPISGIVAGAIYSAQDMARMQYAQGMQEQYNNLREQGESANLAYPSANSYAKTTAGIQGVVGLGVGALGLRTGGQAATEAGMLSKQFLINLGKNSGFDFAVGSSSTALDNYIAKSLGSDKGVDEDVIKQGGLMVVQGLVVAAITGGIATLKNKVTNADIKMAKKSLAMMPTEDLQRLFSNAKVNGSNVNEVNKLQQDVQNIQTVQAAMPPDLTAEQKEKVQPLMERKLEVIQQLENKSFPTEKAEAEIESLDKQINETIGTPLTEKELKEYYALKERNEAPAESGPESPKLRGLNKTERELLQHYQTRLDAEKPTTNEKTEQPKTEAATPTKEQSSGPVPEAETETENLKKTAAATGNATTVELNPKVTELEKPATINGVKTVEHGEDTHTANGLENGIKPTELTDKGKADMAQRGQEIADQKPDLEKIISSPVKRSVDSANIIADESGKKLGKTIPVETNPNLATAGIGDADGKPEGTFDEHKWAAGDNHGTGEPFNAFKARMQRAYQDLKDTPDNVLAMTHSKVMRAMEALKGTDGKWTGKTTKEYLKLGDQEKAQKYNASDQVVHAKQEIEKGVLNWDGNRLTPRIKLEGIEWGDIRKGAEDIKNGEVTAASKRLVEALNKAKEAGGYEYIEGSGGITRSHWVPLDHPEIVNELKAEQSEAESRPISQEETEKLAQEYDKRGTEEPFGTDEGAKGTENATHQTPATAEQVPDAGKEVTGKDKVGRGLDKLTSILGGKQSFSDEERPQLLDALKDIGEGLIESGQATIENVVQKIKDYLGDRIKPEDFDSIRDELQGTFSKDKFQTGGKNEITDKELDELGLSPVEKEGIRSIKGTWDKIKGEVDKGERNPVQDAKDFIDGTKKKWTFEDEVANTYQKAVIKNKLNTERETLSDAAMKDDKLSYTDTAQKIAKLKDDFYTLAEAAKKGSGEAGAVLRFRQLETTEDYSIANVESRARAANNGNKIPEEVSKKLQDLTDKLDESDKKIADYEQRLKEVKSATESQKAINKMRDEVGKSPKRTVDAIRADRQKILASIKAKLSTPASGQLSLAGSPLINILPDVAKLAKSYVEEGVVRLDDLVKKVHGDLKDSIAGLTERDVRDAISGYEKPEKSTLKKPDQQQLAELKKQGKLTSQLEDVQAGNLPQKAEKSIQPIDKRALALRAENKGIKNKIDDEIQRLEYKNRTGLEKMINFATGWTRFALISGPNTVVKLGAAGALQSLVFTPARQLVQAGLAKLPVISRIAAKAPGEGHISLKALGENYGAWLKKETYGQAVQKLKTDYTDIDLAQGQKRLDLETNPLFKYMNNLHGAIKVLPFTAEYFKQTQLRSEYEMSRNDNINTPEIQNKIHQAAYDDATRNIFMNENRLNDLYKSSLGQLQGYGTGGKIVAGLIRIAFPIVKVPVNIVNASSSYTAGGVKALWTLRNGIDALDERQADHVMRSMGSQAIGALGMAATIGLWKHFGGLYAKGDKRSPDDLKPGDIDVDGVHISHVFLHHPGLYAANIISETQRLWEQNKGKKDYHIGDALIQSVAAVGKEIPFLEGASSVGGQLDAQKPIKSMLKAAGKEATNIIIPQAIQQPAKWFDDKQRYPTDFVDQLKTGLPGLRETVSPAKNISDAYKQASKIHDTGDNDKFNDYVSDWNKANPKNKMDDEWIKAVKESPVTKK